MNKVVGVALAGVALYGLVRLLKMQTVSDLASLTLVNPRVHNVSLAGMSLRTEVAVNNASRDSVKVKKLTEKGALVCLVTNNSVNLSREIKNVRPCN
jgi:uncharacterized membrane protein